MRPSPRTSFHHQPEAQHLKSSAIHKLGRPITPSYPPNSGATADISGPALWASAQSRCDRDRGEPCGSSPPTPPCVRVRTRRFDGLRSHHDVGNGVLGCAVRHGWFGPFPVGPWGFTGVFRGEGQLALGIRPLSTHRVPAPTDPDQSFGPSSVVTGSADLLPRLSALGCLNGLADVASTMPSADFCGAVRAPHGVLSPVAGTSRRSPEVSSTAFATHPPDLQGPSLDGWGLRDPPLARPDGPASYPVFVHQVVTLLHASFRRRLAETPLRFASTSPPSGCAGDLHPQAVEHARHTVAGTVRCPGREATRGVL